MNYGDILLLKCHSLVDCARELIQWAVTRLAFPVAVIFIFVAGFLFVTAQGNEEKIKRARSTLAWALLGLAVAVGAWALAEAFQSFFRTR